MTRNRDSLGIPGPVLVAEALDSPPARRRPHGRLWLILLAVLAAVALGGGTALSYYVEALWFGSLGFTAVFWKTVNVQAAVFATS
jgi:hypothetical protein